MGHGWREGRQLDPSGVDGPVTLDRVVLYDRPNLEDRVTAGALVFSDGSTVTVGSLSNSGGATTVTFPARSVTECAVQHLVCRVHDA